MADNTSYINGKAQKENSSLEMMGLTESPHHNTWSDSPSTASQKRRQFCKYRQLAIASILCGCSCIGIPALIFAVKAEEKWKHDPESARKYSRRAYKYSVISIVVFFLTLLLLVAFLVLVSYIVTLIE